MSLSIRLGSVCALALALAPTTGCATKSLWRWARETRYEITPSSVECRGVSAEGEAQNPTDRLWFVVRRGYAAEPEGWTLDVSSAWRGLELSPASGERRLVELLEFAPADALEPAARLDAEAIVQLTDPRVDEAPKPYESYGWFLNRDGILSAYSPHERAPGWVRLADLPTARTIEVSPSPFHYVLATAATPVTVAVDIVGLAGYVLLWPLWASTGIGYGTTPEDRHGLPGT